MSTNFGGYYPAIRRKDDRERLWFIGAAGALFALTIIMVVVLNLKDPATASQNIDRDKIAPAADTMSTVALLAPARMIRAGQKLSDVELKQVFWPRNQVPEEAVLDRSELREYFALKDISPDVPLQRSFLTKTPGDDALPVTPGMRAVSIEVDAISGIEGHADVGTRVDVVLTFTEGGELSSKILVQNSRILSKGGDNSRSGSEGRIARGPRTSSRTVTLEVAQADALKILTAKERGKLSLILRAAEDDKGATVDSMSIEQTTGNKKSIANKNEACKRHGTAKMGGRELVVGCDGIINELEPTEEP